MCPRWTRVKGRGVGAAIFVPRQITPFLLPKMAAPTPGWSDVQACLLIPGPLIVDLQDVGLSL